MGLMDKNGPGLHRKTERTRSLDVDDLVSAMLRGRVRAKPVKGKSRRIKATRVRTSRRGTLTSDLAVLSRRGERR